MNTTTALDRARVYRTLAGLFHRPGGGAPRRLQDEVLAELRPALRRLGAGDDLLARVSRLSDALATCTEEGLLAQWNAHFEPTGGLRCPPTETSHTARTPQEAWLKTYRIADIAGFYRAFGVEVTPGTERPDHLAVELEFLQLLAAKAAAASARGREDQTAICDDAARTFLADHLGDWCGDLTSMLQRSGQAPLYLAAAELLEAFVAFDRDLLGPPAEPASQQQ